MFSTTKERKERTFGEYEYPIVTNRGTAKDQT
jgi:hypothetical protein